MIRARTAALLGVATIVGTLVAGSSVATAAPASAHICIPVIWPCDDPEPEPSDTPSATPTPTPGASATSAPGDDDEGGSNGGTGAGAGDEGAGEANDSADKKSDEKKDDSEESEPRKWSLIGTDDTAVFTQPSAQMGSESLSFSGLKGIALVKLTLADGSQTTAIRLRADRITIKGFSLTIRAETGPKLVTTADTMTLRGNVNVYVNSLTATTPSGKSYTLGADTPPPADGITPKLLRVTLGLVGSTADEISYSNTDQSMHE